MAKPVHASARKPKRKSPRPGTQVIPEPFACSAIVHGERVYVAQDMRHDEAEAYADHIGAQAVEGVWLSKHDATELARLVDRRLSEALTKATTVLEGVE